jgi:predicted glycosyltransferase
MIKGEAHVEVWRTGTVREAIRDAAVVVSRAGYNSSAMLMSTDLPVILVPADKVFVGRDQWPRALRLAALPGIWAIEENHPDAVIQLARAMDAALRQGRVPRQLGWNLNGAETAARWVIAEAQDAQREEEQHRGLMIG